MPELRFDVTTQDWVVFAPERAKRKREIPSAESWTDQSPQSDGCPFCPGNEAMTPEEIVAETLDGDSRWLVRVVANKYPALRPEGSSGRVLDGACFQHMNGYGRHEVLIESPEHNRPLAQQPLSQIELILRTLHDRYAALMREERVLTVVIFKNHGPTAGTSLHHPHWQLVAMPVVPRSLRLKQYVAVQYLDQMGRNLHTDLLDAELAAGRRVIADCELFAAVTPYASHAAYEVWILPKHQRQGFGRLPGDRFAALASILRRVLNALGRLLGEPDFNLTFDTAPKGDGTEEYFLWHVRVIPRLNPFAGFELGSGMAINPVLPEVAADELREAMLTQPDEE